MTDGNELVVALASSLLVGDKGKLRIKRLAVRSKHLRVVEHVVEKERLGITVERNVDLSERIVRSGLGTSSRNTSLKPRLKQTKAISRFGNLHKFIDRTGGSDSHQETLDEVLVRTKVKKTSNDLRCLSRRHLGHVHLNVLKQTVQVQVLGKLVDKVETVAYMNERTRIGQLGILQVFLHLFRNVNVGVTAHTLGFLELSEHDTTTECT